MLVSELIHAFQLNDQLVLDEQISNVLAYSLPLITNRKRSLTRDIQRAEDKLPHQSPLINLLQKPGPKHVRHLVSRPDNRLHQTI